MLETIPLLFESPESLEKLIVAVFSIVAAAFTLWAKKLGERKKNEIKQKIETAQSNTDKYLEMAFQELKNTVDLLRYENQHLLEYNRSLGHKIDEYRTRYQEQLEQSAEYIVDQIDHERTINHIRELDDKVDRLMSTLDQIICHKDES